VATQLRRCSRFFQSDALLGPKTRILAFAPGAPGAMSAVLAPIVAALGAVESADGAIQTEPFLAACRLVLPVFDKLGVAFAAAKSDVSGNIERLAKRAPDHAALFDICRAEMAAGTQASDAGCCKGLLWLKRFLEFAANLLEGLAAEPRTAPLKEVAHGAYATTLKPYHGWLASSAFAVVLQFPPSREAFVNSLNGDYENMTEVARKLRPTLERIHKFLNENGLHDESKV